jgi:hypothetical protein
VEIVKAEFAAKTMGLDPKSHNLFVDIADFDSPANPGAKGPGSPPRPKPGTFRVRVYGR